MHTSWANHLTLTNNKQHSHFRRNRESNPGLDKWEAINLPTTPMYNCFLFFIQNIIRLHPNILTSPPLRALFRYILQNDICGSVSLIGYRKFIAYSRPPRLCFMTTFVCLFFENNSKWLWMDFDEIFMKY